MGGWGKYEDLGEGWLLEAQTLEAARTEFESQLHRPTPCMSRSKTLAIWELSFLICKVDALGAPTTGLLGGVSDMSLPTTYEVLLQNFLLTHLVQK